MVNAGDELADLGMPSDRRSLRETELVRETRDQLVPVSSDEDDVLHANATPSGLVQPRFNRHYVAWHESLATHIEKWPLMQLEPEAVAQNVWENGLASVIFGRNCAYAVTSVEKDAAADCCKLISSPARLDRLLYLGKNAAHHFVHANEFLGRPPAAKRPRDVSPAAASKFLWINVDEDRLVIEDWP